jgi:type IV secretion system protein VirB6
MWHGYEVIRGKGGTNHFLDILAMSVRVGLVIGLGLTLYEQNVIGFINQFISYFSDLFGSTGSALADGSSKNVMLKNLDESCGTALDSFQKLWEIAWGLEGNNPSHITFGIWTGDFDMTGLMMIIQGALMIVAFGVYACIAAFELLYISIALLIFYAIGPLFIAAYAFKTTEQWFNSWLQGVMKYAMTAIVIGMVLGLGNSILAGYVDRIKADLNVVDLYQLGIGSLLASMMLILIIRKVPELAASIIGTVALSTASSTGVGMARAVKDFFASKQSSTPPNPAGRNTHSETRNEGARAGFSRGIGALIEGAGKGVGGLAQGVGAAASGLGQGIGKLASGNQGTGNITNSNAGLNKRPPGKSLASMNS